jgi:hypothetical protein
MKLHMQAFRQLKSQRISKKPRRNKLMNQLRSDSDFCAGVISRSARNCLMKNYTKILFSILAAAICTSAFAAEPTPQSCKKTGKNCPMNDNKKCNCGKDCSC